MRSASALMFELLSSAIELRWLLFDSSCSDDFESAAPAAAFACLELFYFISYLAG